MPPQSRLATPRTQQRPLRQEALERERLARQRAAERRASGGLLGAMRRLVDRLLGRA